jgi:hypothetical protein
VGSYCIEPALTFTEPATKYNPFEKLRSSLVKVSSNAVINCGVSYSKSIQWVVNEIDPVSYGFLRKLDLSSNPSSVTGELIFAENSMQYGLYEFTFTTSLTFSSSQTVSSTIQTYVQIVPSGIAVVSIDKGINEIKIGSNQRFYLRPAVYSYDLDGLILSGQLNFAYYCKVIRLDSANQIPDSQIDLETYKLDNGLTMNRNETCFGLNSNIYF